MEPKQSKKKLLAKDINKLSTRNTKLKKVHCKCNQMKLENFLPAKAKNNMFPHKKQDTDTLTNS